MVTSSRLIGLSVIGLLGMAAASVHAAAIIICPTGATASSHYDFNTVAENTINGGGLSGGGQQNQPFANPLPTGAAVPTTGSWNTASPENDFGNTNGGYRWHDAGPAASTGGYGTDLDGHPTITFDLGAAYDLTAFHMWNMNQDTGTPDEYLERAIRTAGLSVSLDNAAYTPVTGPSEFLKGLGATGNYEGDDYAFVNSNVRYVKFAVATNWSSDGGPANPYTGMDEIRFIGTAVPEPTSLAMLSLAGLGLMRRRR